MNKVFFNSSSGEKIYGIWNIPSKKTDKCVVLAHGITVDKEEDGVFTKLAEYLCENDFAVFRFDFRGSGESEGKSVDMTIQGEIKDLNDVITYTSTSGYLNIGLLGASFGGGIAALYVANNKTQVKSLCMWNPVLNYDHCFLNPITMWMKDKIIPITVDFVQKGWSTLGSSKFIIGKQLFEEMKSIYPYRELRKITIPIVAIHGDKDTYVPHKDTENYMKGLGKFYTIEGAEHGFHNSKVFQKKANELSGAFFSETL